MTSRRLDWDKVGISLSSVCVAHCILTPIAFIALPALGYAAGEHTHGFHWFMLALLLPVALVAFVRGYNHHRQILPLLLGVLGVALIVSAVTFIDAHDFMAKHLAVNILGSVLLLTGHIQNRRCHKQCGHHHH